MPILCPKNSNSSLKKSDLDSLTFNLDSRNFWKIFSRCWRCCHGESLKINKSSMNTTQKEPKLKNNLFIRSFKKSGLVAIPKDALVNSNFPKLQMKAVLCLSSGFICDDNLTLNPRSRRPFYSSKKTTYVQF